ncbi:MAG: iron ABC transporter permease [Candidatus Methanoplasma sp.]|jgi:iron complex transport system permease protein|nr:iron ABC transporter permease [Candidatus Methanoplasma sp.]
MTDGDGAQALPSAPAPEAQAGGSGERWRRRHAKEKLALILGGGALGIALLFVYSLTMGIYPISFSDAMGDIWSIIANLGPSGEMSERVIYHLRMPRSVAVLCVGAGLATAGAAMQALIRNPLVDPYITGVSSGASFMVVLFTIGGFSLGASSLSIPIAAIIGALCAFGLTMLIAEMAGGKAMSYVLSGVIISTGLSAAITLLIYFNSKEYQQIMKWMFGSFADIPWSSTAAIAVGTIIPIAITLCFARKLNVMLLGDEHAKYLGVDTAMLKKGLMVLIAVLAAFCVAYCGVIGFIGLIIPHVCRMVIGGDHRLLIPASAVLGALVLLIADVFCKTAAAPSELPIGAVVAVIGVPFFLFLMMKEGKRYAM